MCILRWLIALFLGLPSICFAQQFTWTHLSPNGSGPLTNGQGSQSTAYDEVTDRLIIFGGADNLGCCNESTGTSHLSAMPASVIGVVILTGAMKQAAPAIQSGHCIIYRVRRCLPHRPYSRA